MTLTRHAIGSGRALFTLPGGRFYNATKPLEGRILDMTHTPTPWAVNEDGWKVESDKEHGWVNDGWIVCSTEGPDAKSNAALIVTAVNAFEANQARIAELEKALRPFAEASDVFAREYPAMLEKPATSCGIRFDALQTARAALSGAQP
jgi:hypothetical protein